MSGADPADAQGRRGALNFSSFSLQLVPAEQMMPALSEATGNQAPSKFSRANLRFATGSGQQSRCATMAACCGGGERGPVILPAFKAGDPALCGLDGGFDSHTLPPQKSNTTGVF